MTNPYDGLTVRERRNFDKERKKNAGDPPLTPAVASVCPNCGASGSDPCTTPSGKVKDTWHAKREA